MSEIAQEVTSQPECWEQAARLAGSVSGALPGPGERVLAVGCGTSLHIARAYASLRESSGAGETDAAPASEAFERRRYDRVVVLSRSGTTTEVIRLMERLEAPSVALTADGSSPGARLAADAGVLDFADERSIVQTRFATTALALLRAHLGHDLATAVEQAGEALGAGLPEDLGSLRHVVFLGRGWTVGLADEAALKVREASGAFSESYPAMEYRHGPISVAGEGSLVWAFAGVEPDVLEDVRATGARVVAGRWDPMAELVLVHRTAIALAELRGLDPDHPRHLTRSVVLS
jgi:fructoselysine-6-P-deglycase FrlB-like protein